MVGDPDCVRVNDGDMEAVVDGVAVLLLDIVELDVAPALHVDVRLPVIV